MAGGAFGGGTGVLADPYLVEDAADLDAVRNDLAAYYKLTANIDLSSFSAGAGWNPIGTYSTAPFSGSIDGNSKTISNLTVNTTAVNVGFFADLSGEIKDVTFTNVSMTSTNAPFGTLVGRSSTSTGKITNVAVSGSMSVHGTQTGGLIGNGGGTISNSSFTGDITATGTNNNGCGGLIGLASMDTVIDTGSFYSGSISGVYQNAGGLIGYLVDDISIDITDSHASGGTIQVHGAYSSTNNQGIGGLIGGIGSVSTFTVAKDVVITNSYSTLDIDASTATTTFAFNIGGLIGDSHDGYKSITVTDCYYSGSISTKVDGKVGGLMGSVTASTGRTAKFSGCASFGAITNTATSSVSVVWVGGLLGGATSIVIVEDCYTKMSITGATNTMDDVGGAFGFLSISTSGAWIRRTYCASAITCNATSKDAYAGAFTSSNANTGNNFYDSDVAGAVTSTHATGKTTVEMKQEATYTTFDFTTPIWVISEGSSYAFLTWQTNDQPPGSSIFPSPPAGVTDYIIGVFTFFNDVGGFQTSPTTCWSITDGSPDTSSFLDSNAVYTSLDPEDDWFGYRLISLGATYTIQKYTYDGITWTADGDPFTASAIKIKLYSGYHSSFSSADIADTPVPTVDPQDISTYPSLPYRYTDQRGDGKWLHPWVIYNPTALSAQPSGVLHGQMLFKLTAGTDDNDITWKIVSKDDDYDSIQFKDDNSNVDVFEYIYDIANGFWKNGTPQTPGVPSYANFGKNAVDKEKGASFQFWGGSTAPTDPAQPPSTDPTGTYTPPPSTFDPNGDSSVNGSTIPAGAISYQLRIVTPQGIKTIPLVDTSSSGLVIATPKDGKKYIPFQ